MQNSTAKDGPSKPRPRSFIGGDSFEFDYDGHYGGLKSTTRSLDRKEKRPMSLYESLSQDMYAARRHSASSSRPDEDGGHGDKARGFSRLDSKEKADEVNKDRENVRLSLSNDTGGDGLGTRTSSDAADSRKAARQLYAELSSPPLKTVAGDEKFNAVSRLRSLFDQSNSAPSSRKTYSLPQRTKETHRLSNSENRKSFEEASQLSPRKHEQAKFEFQHRRPKFEKVEAEKKRKLFAPPAPVKLDVLLKRDSPRSPEENKDFRFRRSSSKENEPPVQAQEKASEHHEQPTQKKDEVMEPTKKSFSQDIVQSRPDHDAKTDRPHSYHEKTSSIEKDRFDIIHERRRSLPKKRSSSFEFEALEDNIAVFGKNTIDINAMLGLEPPSEDPVAEACEEQETQNVDVEIVNKEQPAIEIESKECKDERNSPVSCQEKRHRFGYDHDAEKTGDGHVGIPEKIPTEMHSKFEENKVAVTDLKPVTVAEKEDTAIPAEKLEEGPVEIQSEVEELELVKDGNVNIEILEKEPADVHKEELCEELPSLQAEIAEVAEIFQKEDYEIEARMEEHVKTFSENEHTDDALPVEEHTKNLTKSEEKLDDNDNYDHYDINNSTSAKEIELNTEYVAELEEDISHQMKDQNEESVETIEEPLIKTDERSSILKKLENSFTELNQPVDEEVEISLFVDVQSSREFDFENDSTHSDTEEVVSSHSGSYFVEQEETKDIITEDAIMPEAFLEAESTPDFDMLNGEIGNHDSGLEYDSFDSFALNVREPQAHVIVDKAITETVYELVERNSAEDSVGETQEENELSHVDLGEKHDLKEEIVGGNAEFHVDPSQDVILIDSALLQNEEECTDQHGQEEQLSDQEGKGSENELHKASADSESLMLAEKEDDRVSMRIPDPVADNLEVSYFDTINPLQDTVELDDEEYDSDHSMVSEGSPQEYSFQENAYDEDEDRMYVEDHSEEDHSEEDQGEEDQDGEEEDQDEVNQYESKDIDAVENHEYQQNHVVDAEGEEEEEHFEAMNLFSAELPPTPSQSCLAIKTVNQKQHRKVSFQSNITDVIYTYSPEEYNRGSNAMIDTVTASAEWELEKRVEEKDIFSVDLDKRVGGLGLSIIGLGVSTESGVEKLGIFIKSLTPNGAAHKDRRIQVQDQILEVNGISLVGVTQEFAARTLKNTSGNVRFLMGRDKTKKHYQAPTSTADGDLQELEHKHNIEMNDLLSNLSKAEERASNAENNLEEVREALLDAEDRLHVVESELEDSREEINLMRQKQGTKQSGRIEELERTLSDLSRQLSSSEEKQCEIQAENEVTIEDLRARWENAEQQVLECKRENNHLVSMLQKNAEKLNEAEQGLAVIQKETVERSNQDGLLKDRQSELEREVEVLKEENEASKKKSEACNECQDYAKQIGRLEEQIHDLKEELELKKQFSDVVITERDSFKALVNNLERAHEKLQEAEEKMQIENAVKKMSYENKIQELEDTIKMLRVSEAVDNVPHKKLFPEIERPKIEREIEIQVESSQPVQSKPYFIPPPDYDEEPVETDIKQPDVDEKNVPSLVSESEHEHVESSDDENDEIIVESTLSVQECVPDFSFVEDSESSGDVIDGGDEFGGGDAIGGGHNIGGGDAIGGGHKINGSNDPFLPDTTGVVNPIEKPPRRYSDHNAAKTVKDLTLEEPVIEESSQEEIIVEPEKERSESILNAFEKLETEEKLESEFEPKQDIEIKRSGTFEVIIKKGPIKTSDSFFKDLPESSVDSPEASDIEMIAEPQNSDDNTDGVENQVNLVDIMHQIPPPSIDSSTAPDIPDHDKDNPDADQTEIPDSKDKEGKVNSDRSSFFEALSQNPSFGSWLNGELTIIEHDRKEEQAEEIASKVAEHRGRGFSTSSSSSSEDEKEHDDDHHKKVDLSTSIRLDESYLTASQPRLDEEDTTDSPLLRQESSVDEMGSLAEPAIVARPISINFDEVVPVTTVLENSAQHDKRKLASAIPRKSPRKPSSPNIKETLAQPEEQKVPSPLQASSTLSASADNLSTEATANANVINIEYGAKKEGDKDKRKSIFSFLPKFGGKKKHKRSMENLLAPDEANAGPAASRDPSPARSDKHDDDEGVVPFDVKHDANTYSATQPDKNAPVAFEVKINGDPESATLVSSGDSNSASSSINVLPATGNIAGSTENLSGGDELENGQEHLSAENRQSWMRRPVNEWDVRQVGLWLIRMDLEAYSQTFQERNIDGPELLNLNGARLKELGVMHGDHRALIKRKIKEFKLNIDKDHRTKDSKKDGKSKDKSSKKVFWKGKYTINQ